MISLFALFSATLVTGFLITRCRSSTLARAAAWLLVVGSCLSAERLTANGSGVLRMVAIVLALIWSLKCLVSVEEQASGKARLPAAQWWMFALGWLGMRPSEFAAAPGAALAGWRDLMRRGMLWLLPGACLLALARLLGLPSLTAHDPTRFLLTAALLLVGFSLILHFGLINLLAGLWRLAGANCRALFRAPLYARSLAEFWGKRWNLAFSEMAALTVFRPLRRRWGPQAASVAAFLFSGVLHELAISVPVRAGFGLPLAYFSLHAIAVALEQALARAGWAMERMGWIGRVWTALWILVPLPLLFHAAFLRGCLWPLVQAS